MPANSPRELQTPPSSARFSTPLAEAGIINRLLINDFGNQNQRVIAPGSVETSMTLLRITQLGSSQMPPLATRMLNQPAIDLLTAWVSSGIAPEFRQPKTTPGNITSFEFTGLPNQFYRLESSLDLNAWSPAATATTDANGLGRADAADFGSESHRFYRVRLP